MQESIKIVVLGASGNGLDIVDTLLDINQNVGYSKYQCIGFLDDKSELQNKNVYLGYKVLGKIKDFTQFSNDVFFITAIGSSTTYLHKKEIISFIPSSRFITLIHPTAYVSRSAEIGLGGIVLQNVTIANNVHIGNQVVILANTVINHDCIIGDYTCVASGVCISGNVKIQENCYIGTNAAIKENLTIGEKCLIGMGSNVLNDIENGSIVAGNPAKALKAIEQIKTK